MGASAVSWLAWLVIASWVVAVLSAPSVLLSRAARPMAGLSWMLAMFALPVVGVLAWWMVGRFHLTVRRRQRQRAQDALKSELRLLRPESGGAFPGLPCLPAGVRDWVLPPTSDNAVDFLSDAAVAYDAWERAIDEAKAHVHALFYIWNDDATGRRFRDALLRAARRGVCVRVLVDGVGTPRSGFFDELRDAGADVRWFLPPWRPRQALAFNFRNHRKVLVTDATTAFVGGINIGDEYLRWADYALEVRGSAAAQLQEIFCDDWFFATGEELISEATFRFAGQPEGTATVATIAGGPHQPLNAIREVMLALLSEARERIWLTTPYFIPDAALLAVLRVAVYRGVDVRVLVPSRSDVRLVRRASRAYYPELLSAGVRVFEHREMVHAKSALLDRQRAFIGSANLDQRSFRLNFEVTSVVDSEAFNAAVEAQWLALQAQATEVRLEDYRRLTRFERIVDATLHLASPLL